MRVLLRADRMSAAHGAIQPAARFVLDARAPRAGASPIFSRIASINARTFGDGSRVDGNTA